MGNLDPVHGDINDGRRTMPVYDFRCKKCRKKLTLKMSFRDYEAKKFKCSKCGSKQLERLVSPFGIQISKKS